MHIQLPTGTLVPDQELADEWGVTRRTLARYEGRPDGLPFVMVGGEKYRPIEECREWLARQISRPNPRRKAA